LCNQPIRTVVVRNWRDTNFLHTVFLRLNTGSVTLSPQELRQALIPGLFSDYVDEAAGQSTALRQLLGIAAPDPRMRDIEILARFLAFRFFSTAYPGRMKEFLDSTFAALNDNWDNYKSDVQKAVADFEKGVEELLRIFGDELARKPTSPQFNRAIFDALIFFHSQRSVRKAMVSKRSHTRKAYEKLFSNNDFVRSIESDTAGAPNTLARLKIWAAALSSIAGRSFVAPAIPTATGPKKSKNAKVKRQRPA
jgi:hypothetical protein